MSNNQPGRTSGFVRTVRKFFVSAFVVFTFAAYAVHERLAGSDGGVSALAPSPSPSAPQLTIATPQPFPPTATAVPATPQPAPATEQAAPTPLPTAQPTPTDPPPTAIPSVPAPTAIAGGQLKDGEYTGASVDAFYGNVQVKAIIQAGKIADVQTVEYPNDRRTSIRINTIAIPYLRGEVIQAQSAEVDIISGATLTSEAYLQSLQSALDTAKG